VIFFKNCSNDVYVIMLRILIRELTIYINLEVTGIVSLRWYFDDLGHKLLGLSRAI